jgi:hypothetical protein
VFEVWPRLGYLLHVKSAPSIEVPSFVFWCGACAAKTCLVLLFGFLVFGYEVSAKNLLGITIAVGGLMYYSHVKLQAAAVHSNSSATGSISSAPLTSVTSTSGPSAGGRS